MDFDGGCDGLAPDVVGAAFIAGGGAVAAGAMDLALRVAADGGGPGPGNEDNGRAFACGCQCNRNTLEAIERAFATQQVSHDRLIGLTPLLRPLVTGQARAA